MHFTGHKICRVHFIDCNYMVDFLGAFLYNKEESSYAYKRKAVKESIGFYRKQN